MLKKFFVASVVSVLVLVGGQANFCGATMPRTEMFLGGFTVDVFINRYPMAASSYSAMKRVYGEPVQDEGHAEANYSSHYGDTVHIGFNNIKDRIQSITVTANNGWKTPSGLAVGDNISKALDMYGAPDYKKAGAYKTAYCYFHRSNQGYLDFGFIILFNNESEKILQLKLTAGSDMYGFEEGYKGWMDRMIQ